MSSEIQPYQLNNIIINDLREIPTLSFSSKKILETFEAHLPPPFQEMPCKDDWQIQRIEETKQLLNETKDHSTRDKVIAFLKTAAVVVLVVGIVAACIFGGLGLGLGLGLIAFVIVNAVLYEDARRKIEKIEQKLPGNTNHWSTTIVPVFAGILGAGLYMPLIEAYTRKSRLEKVLQKLNESNQNSMSGYNAKLLRNTEENNQLLARASEFYLTQSPGLIERIDQKIEQFEKSLKQFEKSLAGMVGFDETSLKAPREFLENHQKARAELNAIFEFYLQQNKS